MQKTDSPSADKKKTDKATAEAEKVAEPKTDAKSTPKPKADSKVMLRCLIHLMWLRSMYIYLIEGPKWTKVFLRKLKYFFK